MQTDRQVSMSFYWAWNETSADALNDTDAIKIKWGNRNSDFSDS